MASALEECADTRSNGRKAPPGRADLEHVTLVPERQFESMELLIVEDKDDAVK